MQDDNNNDLNEWLERMRERLQHTLQQHVEREWVVTEEVSGTGTLITRARHRTAPIEVINGERGMYELVLN